MAEQETETRRVREIEAAARPRTTPAGAGKAPPLAGSPSESDPSDRRDPETWMWERARAMLERADRLQRTFFHPRRPGDRRPSWEPPVDVFESADGLWVLVALPGVDVERVQVELDGALLLVRGERVLPEALRSARMHRLEIPHGSFERSIELPVDLSAGGLEIRQTQASQGCLILHLVALG